MLPTNQSWIFFVIVNHSYNIVRIESAYHYPSIGAAAPPPTEAASGAAGGPETVGSTDLLDSFPEAVTLSQQEASRQAAATAGQASGGGGGAWKSGGAAVESASLNFASIAKQVSFRCNVMFKDINNDLSLLIYIPLRAFGYLIPPKIEIVKCIFLLWKWRCLFWVCILKR